MRKIYLIYCLISAFEEYRNDKRWRLASQNVTPSLIIFLYWKNSYVNEDNRRECSCNIPQYVQQCNRLHIPENYTSQKPAIVSEENDYSLESFNRMHQKTSFSKKHFLFSKGKFLISLLLSTTCGITAIFTSVAGSPNKYDTLVSGYSNGPWTNMTVPPNFVSVM